MQQGGKACLTFNKSRTKSSWRKMYVFPAGGICTMCSKICDEDETQGSTFLTDVWLISTQNWITESYWKFNLKKIGRRIGITKKVVLGFAWRVEDYKSWRWLVMCAGLWLGGTWEHVCRPQPPPATSHTATQPENMLWQLHRAPNISFINQKC